LGPSNFSDGRNRPGKQKKRKPSGTWFASGREGGLIFSRNDQIIETEEVNVGTAKNKRKEKKGGTGKSKDATGEWLGG